MGLQTVEYVVTGDRPVRQRVHGKGGEIGSSGDNEERGGQESELLPDEESVVRGTVDLSGLVRWCPVPHTKSGELTSVGSGIVSRNSPLKSYS